MPVDDAGCGRVRREGHRFLSCSPGRNRGRPWAQCPFHMRDLELQVIFERWSGPITAEDLGRHWRSCLADPAAMALRRTVADLRGATPGFTSAERARLINETVLPTLQGRDWVTAIIVDQPVPFGISRQHQVFAESCSADAIFDEPERALEGCSPFHGAPPASPA